MIWKAIIGKDIILNTNVTSWEKKLINNQEIKIILYLLWNFISIKKYYKSWDINTKIIKESKSKKN